MLSLLSKFYIPVLAAVCLIALGGFLIKQYGVSQQKIGKAQCLVDIATANDETIAIDGKAKDETEKKANAMDTGGFINGLSRLGVLRSNDDR